VVAIRDITERKQAEDAVRESEERFRRLSEAAFEGIAIHEKGTILDANEALATMFGYEPTEPIGMTALEMTAPESRDLMSEKIRVGYLEPFEAVGLRKDGSTFVVELHAKPVPYQGRRVSVVAIRDITERKRAEEALRESEAKFRHLFENLQDVYFRTTIEGILTDVSPSIEKYGYRPNELIGTQVLVGYENPEERPALLNRLLEQGEIEDYELRLKAPDGRLVDVSVNARVARGPDGEPAAFEGSLRDITDRKRSEESLRESEERFRTLSQAALEGILIHENGKILDANRALATMSGYEPSEVVGMNVSDFMLPESRDLVRKKAVSRHEEHYEAMAVKKDGSTLWLEIRGRPMSYRGRAARVVSIRDISERKQTEDALQDAREELEERVERRMQCDNAYGLTFRELTVLHLASDGKSDREIGVQLGISPLTARKHVENILAKMDSTGRTEASVRALREGLLD
jgi:PAS domain S-box-containing protein